MKSTIKNKNQRLDALRLLLATQHLTSQNEIILQLKKEGFKVTQTTLSRDLKQIKAIRKTDSNGIYYSVPENERYTRVVNGVPLSAKKMQIQNIHKNLSNISQLFHDLSVQFKELADSYLELNK